MFVKKGDKVRVIAGKDKGVEAVVLKALPKVNKVVVEGVAIVKKHQKPKGPQHPGGIVEMEAPIHVSNVMYFDSKTGKGTKLGYRIEDGKKVRFKKSDGNTIK